jgi:hypothetical protein
MTGHCRICGARFFYQHGGKKYCDPPKPCRKIAKGRHDAARGCTSLARSIAKNPPGLTRFCAVCALAGLRTTLEIDTEDGHETERCPRGHFHRFSARLLPPVRAVS